jgi:hypothetical protein
MSDQHADDRPTDPEPEQEAPADASQETSEDFRREIEDDPSANPPEELDRLRGG